MDPAEVMLSGFIGVALPSERQPESIHSGGVFGRPGLHCTSGFSLSNSIVSSIFYIDINGLHPQKHYNVLQVNVRSVTTLASARSFSFQKISSLNLPDIGGASHA